MDEYNRMGVAYDSNGDRVEHRWIGGQRVVVHHAFLPDKDLTEIDGTPCTTPLRTVLDLAADLSSDELDRMVRTCLRRQLFTELEALERIGETDMIGRAGSALVLESLWRIAGRG